MAFRLGIAIQHRTAAALGGVLVLSLCMAAGAYAQDHERDDHGRVARLDPGTLIPVRANETIQEHRGENRVFTGTVDRDVRSDRGRLVIPRGAQVELIVRSAADRDLHLDLESVTIGGQRYGLRTDPKNIEAHHDNNLVGDIVGAISGGEAHGREVMVPRDAVVTFRLERPLEVGVPDRGDTRDGHHYHDYYDDHDH